MATPFITLNSRVKYVGPGNLWVPQGNIVYKGKYDDHYVDLFYPCPFEETKEHIQAWELRWICGFKCSNMAKECVIGKHPY